MRCQLLMVLIPALLVSGCFSPSPSEGLPCSMDGECPDGQGCDQISMTCSVAPRPACDSPTSACSGTCVDLAADPQNCGACGIECDSDEVCSNGACASSCAPGLSECGGSCVDLDNDDNNCGACDNPCSDADFECRAGSCQLRCETFLDSPREDPWGAYWDGLERTAATLDVAQAVCEGFGGRLPTVTELHRVSAVQSGAVGQVIHTNELWSRFPHNAANQATVVLADGQVGSENALNDVPYRCICPEDQFTAFSGSNCFGGASNSCISLPGGENMDSQSRPAARKNTAMAECAFDGGHLGNLNQYTDAIQAGVVGDLEWNWVADSARFDKSTLIRWSGDQSATWIAQRGTSGQPGFSWSDMEDPREFRCVGSPIFSANYPQPAATFVGRRYAADSVDNAPETWPPHDTCTARGGHLAQAVELGELIQQGLPGGTNDWLYTADELGLNDSDPRTLRVAVVRWTGVDVRHFYNYSTTAANSQHTWSRKNETRPTRCVYYPIDENYVAPSTCTGGCTEIPFGDTGPRMWFDTVDRPASSLHEAQADCVASGGKLPMARDYYEAIRAGLANGSGTVAALGAEYLWSADYADNTTSSRMVVVRWQDTEPGFTGIRDNDHATWTGVGNQRPYRCMWTNEIR